VTILRAHLSIRGRVQGVNFRYFTHLQALSLGLTGWVRNLWDGRVEVVFEGEEASVRKMVEWCQSGPPAARVDAVDVTWEPPSGEFADFEVRTTGRGM
jgi:acylphosphatase